MKILPLLALVLTSTFSLASEEILFIGNSFTFGAGDNAVKQLGGIPKIIELIAKERGRTVHTTMLANGGLSFRDHLQQKRTDEEFQRGGWQQVVLQEYSTRPTDIGDKHAFLADGEELSLRFRKANPKARIVLYSTWARHSQHPMIAGESKPGHFTSPDEMLRQLVNAYNELQQRLKKAAPDAQTDIAPVGKAFALSQERYPEIPLYHQDYYHASREGSYLAALVIYATLYGDSPLEAPHEFPGIKIDSARAVALQKIAHEVTSHNLSKF